MSVEHRNWWQRPETLARFVADLIEGEAHAQRPGGTTLPCRPWSADMAIGEEGLGLDSLERLATASALNEALHLHESGIEDFLLARGTFGEWLEVVAAGLDHFHERLTFRTSGSSGKPKPCVHRFCGLEQEVDFLGELFAETKRVICAVPAHHIYGFLFTVLLPERLGGLEVIDVRKLTPQALCKLLLPGDLVVSHPHHWKLVARYGTSLADRTMGVTSTAPCPTELAESLVRDIGLSRFVQIYGSSETAGIGWRDNAASPYTVMPHWSRDPSRAESLTRHLPGDQCETHVLQDSLEWQSTHQFVVKRRIDSAVQVGGINVFASRVCDVLLAHPRVEMATVRLMDPEEGSRLKAFIVPSEDVDTTLLRSELERWTQARLAAPECPRSFKFGKKLPMNETGKLRNWSCSTDGE